MQPRTPLLKDFDGTLTSFPGGAVVFSDPYNAVVMNDEIRTMIAANRNAFAQLNNQIAALETEKNLISTQLSDLQFSLAPDIQPLANSGEYHPANLGASGEYTTMDLSTSGEINPEVQQLNNKLFALENSISALNEQKKKYSAAPYIIMGEQKPSQEQIRARSREILEKMHQQPDKHIFKLADGAKEYLLAALADASMPIHIISKNHEEYIRAVLLFNGISEEQINLINIVDLRKGGGNKYAAAGKILQDYPRGTLVIIGDDDPTDYMKMCRVAQERRMRIISRNQPPGQCNFPGILEELAKAIRKAATKTKSTESLSLRSSGMWKRSSSDAEQAEIESPSAFKKSRGSGSDKE